MLPASFQEMMKTPGVTSRDSFLVAVSGGVDSVSLVHLMHREGLNMAIAHANFGLRGNESDEDESFVRQLASRLGIEIFVRNFETRSYAEEKGISTQMAARELRYDWLASLMTTHGYNHLVTAHHLDDEFETVLFNLVKGTGVAGLRGMLPFQNGIFRPLIYTTREEIEAWARQETISWREDSSNAEVVYTRNFIRHRVVPLLRQINPSLADTFRSTLLRLQAADRLIENEAESRSLRYIRKEGSDIYIHKDAFKGNNIAVAERLLGSYGMSFQQISDLLRHIHQDGSTCLYLTEGYRINLDREEVIISVSEPEVPPMNLSMEPGRFRHSSWTIVTSVEPGIEPLNTEPYSVSLDYDRLKEPLIIRKWEEGDRFIPLGMTGKKKISDFMIDEKIPLNLKGRVYVLESGGEIAWVIGHRISQTFRVTRSTVRRFNITISHDQSV